MYVRTIRGQTQPGQVDELVRRWQEQAAPRMKGTPGLRYLYFCGNRAADAVISIALLDDRPDEATRETLSQTFHRFREQVRDIVAGEPVVEEWEVLAQI